MKSKPSNLEELRKIIQKDTAQIEHLRKKLVSMKKELKKQTLAEKHKTDMERAKKLHEAVLKNDKELFDRITAEIRGSK